MGKLEYIKQEKERKRVLSVMGTVAGSLLGDGIWSGSLGFGSSRVHEADERE